MANPEVNLLFHQPITDHSFSADRSVLAVTRDASVELYERKGAGFTLKDELKGHDKTVTSVDIAPKSGRIVTCAQGDTFLVQKLQLLILYEADDDRQIGMHWSGNLLLQDGDQLSSSCELIVLPLLSDGLLLKRNSLSAPVRAS